jgi:hypothetical protein
MRDLGRRHAGNKAGGGHDTVVGAQDGRAQPVAAENPMMFF